MMHFFHTAHSLTAIAVFSLSLIFSGGGAGASEPLPDEFMPLSEIRPGMVGEAFSVVNGFELSTYKVEIMGVETGGLPGTSLIICRVEGPSLGQHGIVAGMSGSPVYIEGRLIGALAYGWSFAYEPLGAITPIENMLPILDHVEQPAPGEDLRGRGKSGMSHGSAGAATKATRGWDWQRDLEAYLNGTTGTQAPEPLSIQPRSARVREIVGDRTLELEPLTSPFTISGASPESVAALDRFMGARGLQLMAAGSNAGSNETPDEPAPPIVGGSALSMPLMTGAVTVASTGTVTYRKGDKLIAFGHPAMARGATNMPMAHSYMFGYMQSYDRSFKLGESREVVGSIRQDRTFGVGGIFGTPPERVDLTVRVSGEGTITPREFHFSIWEDADFLPMLTGFVAVPEAIIGSTSASDRATATSRYTIRLSDGRVVEKTQAISSESGIARLLTPALIRDLFLLLSNPYEQANIDSIDVDIDVTQGYRVDTLLAARPRYEQIEAGEDLELELRWLPYREAEYTQNVTVDLPDDLEPGTYVVHLADFRAAQLIQQRHNPGQFEPLSYEETVALTQDLNYPQNRLSAFVFEPTTGLSVRGDSFGNVPSSVELLMAGTAPPQMQGATVGDLLETKDIDYAYPVIANTTLVVEVVPWKSR